MSWRLTDRVLDLELPGEEERVLLRLARHAYDDGSSARPGLARLGRETGRSTRTVQRGLRALERRGYIRCQAHRQGGRGCATEWQLCVERWPVPAAARFKNPVTNVTLSAPPDPPLEGNPVTHVTLLEGKGVTDVTLLANPDTDVTLLENPTLPPEGNPVTDVTLLDNPDTGVTLSPEKGDISGAKG